MLSCNTSTTDHPNDEEEKIFIDQLDRAQSVIFALIAVFAVLGNTLVLVATWRKKYLHEPNKYFVACLACADLLIGAFVSPLLAYKHSIDFSTISIHLCRFLVWMDTSALSASIYTLTIISLDRYVKISKPLQYKYRVTTSITLKIIFSIWFISAAIGSYASTGQCNITFNSRKEFYTFLAIIVFILPSVVIIVTYTLIYVAVRKRRKMLRNGELGGTLYDQNLTSKFLKDTKAIKLLLVVVGLFMLCMTPFFIWVLLICHYPNFIDADSWPFTKWRGMVITETLLTTLPYLNSLCNPIIYACLDQKYRKAFKSLFQKNSRRRPSNTTELQYLRSR